MRVALAVAVSIFGLVAGSRLREARQQKQQHPLIVEDSEDTPASYNPPTLKDFLANVIKNATDPDLLQIYRHAGKDADEPLPKPALSSFEFFTKDDASILHHFALGDSYASGRGVPNESFVCFRSDHNYPSLLAAAWKPLNFTDVTCSSARSSHIFLHGQWSVDDLVAPQAEALKGDEDKETLITVTVGGNDESLFETTLALCLLKAATGVGCASSGERIVGNKLHKVAMHVRMALRSLRVMKPHALILLIGYPRLTRRDRSCLEFPLLDSDRGWVVELEERVEKLLSDAAVNAGVEFISLREVSKDHEICSDDPVRMAGQLPGKDAFPFHPTGPLIQLMTSEIERRWEDMKKSARGEGA